MDDLPEHGQFLSADHIEMIYEAIEERQKNFPTEPRPVSFALAVQNIGNRFRPLQCVEQEWEGTTYDMSEIQMDGDEPRCPNGHTINKGAPLRLAWLYKNTVTEPSRT